MALVGCGPGEWCSCFFAVTATTTPTTTTYAIANKTAAGGLFKTKLPFCNGVEQMLY